jgi:hypothetical protein
LDQHALSFFILEFALHFGMTVPYIPSSTDLSLLETYKEYLLAWMSSNPGTLCKIGGKQVILKRHHDATQYNPLYFDTSKAIVFPGTSTDPSRLAAWLELMLIQPVCLLLGNRHQ